MIKKIEKEIQKLESQKEIKGEKRNYKLLQPIFLLCVKRVFLTI